MRLQLACVRERQRGLRGGMPPDLGDSAFLTSRPDAQTQNATKVLDP